MASLASTAANRPRCASLAQSPSDVTMRISINPVLCEAFGYCAELLPEAITLDEWGYPIVDGRPLPRNWWPWRSGPSVIAPVELST